MGRKPNQLMLEFFTRGRKLTDSSNRYEHTCKLCGDIFPKGRIDSLTAHLIKKCPAISLRDRHRALLQLNDLPDLPESGQAMGTQVELPLGNKTMTPLETLAEVSRQINLSEKDTRSGQNAGTENRGEEHPRMERFELQEQWTPDNPPVSYEARVQRDKKLLSQRLTPHRDSDNNVAQADVDESGSPLEAMAATAKSMAVAASARFIPMLDPALIGEGLPDSHQSDVPLETAVQQLQSFVQRQEGQDWPMMLDGSDGHMYPNPDNFAHQPQVNTFQALAINNQGMTTEFSTEFGNGQKTSKPKVRGRFTPSRRKEVQEVRKRGACMRCRMLKKPCSDGDPCNTCKSVDSARLWKQACIRSRLAEELDMYAAGLHAVLAYHEVNAVKSLVKFVPTADTIEVSHYPDIPIQATLNALVAQSPNLDSNVDPQLPAALGPTFEGEFPYIFRLFDPENQDIAMKMEAYIKRISPVFYENEPSKFMNVTLNTALELSIQKQDALLGRVLELWSTIHILTDTELSWTMVERRHAENNEVSVPIEEADTHGLLCMQLNAAVEKKAALISKSVLNDLERRLLQRSSTSSFETFLVAVILLNCVEKSTWLFKSWEHERLSARWPLDKTPIWYGAQGDSFTDLLQMILRMRAIPPKTYVTPNDGLLATDVEQGPKEFFEKINLTFAYVLDKHDNPTYDEADSRCYELRFISKLLLPVN